MKKLRKILQQLLEEHAAIESIEVEGKTLEEALDKACVEFDTVLSDLDYEIIEYGSKGVFGLASKPYKLRVYQSKGKSDIFKSVISGDIDDSILNLEEVEQFNDKDGEVFLRVIQAGVMLKVTPPVGNGTKPDLSEVINIIDTRGVTDYELDKVKKVLKQAKDEYTRIGSMPLNVANDAQANVQVSSDKMKAYLIMIPPKIGGYDLEIDEIRNVLRSNGVIFGIIEEELTNLMDYPVYNEPVLVAKGQKVQNGQDAKIVFNFETDKKIHLREVDGKVNFKNLNTIQNVVAGQILAVKEPATEGVEGRTVDGELIPAKPGKDVALNPGKNTAVTEDGMSITAAKNGQVSLNAGKVIVEEVMTVQGDVNLKVGDITFLGNVIVTGSVEDGFVINAQGSIEVKGSVGKSNLIAEGDIIVGQGIMGKNESEIRTKTNLYAKFIENVKYIDVGQGVYVQDAIMHSYVDATKEISCVGKRATIVGGRLRSGELVKTKTLGSKAGTETVIEVGIDPKKRQRMQELNYELESAYKEMDGLKVNFDNLENQKKQYRDKFPKEKLETYNKLKAEIKKYQNIIDKTQEEVDEINQYLASLKNRGRIIAVQTAYPQVKLYIKSANLQLKTEYKKVEFLLENDEINVAQYTETDEDKQTK